MLLIRAKVFALLLEPAGVGILSQVSGIEALLSAFATIGLGYGITNLVAKQSGDIAGRPKVWNLVYLGEALAIGFAILSIAFLLLFSSDLSSIITGKRQYALLFSLLGIALPFKFMAAVYSAALQGLKKISSLAQIRAISAVIGLITVITLTYLWGLSGAVIGVGTWSAIAFVTSRYLLTKETRSEVSRPRNIIQTQQIFPILRFGVVNLMIIVVNNLALIAIRTRLIHLLGPSANGYYQVVWAMSSQFLILVSLSLWSYSFPVLTELVGNQDKLTEQMQGILRLGLLLIGPMIYFLTTFRGIVVSVLYSDAFSPSISLIPVQVWGDLLRLLMWWLELPLYARGKLRNVLAIEVLWNFCHLALSFLMLPRFGIIGVSISYSIASILTMAGFLLLSRKSLDYQGASNQTLLFYQVCLLIIVGLIASGNLLSRSIMTVAVIPVWAIWVTSSSEREYILNYIKDVFASRRSI